MTEEGPAGTDTDTHRLLAARLREARHTLGLTQQNVADATGLHRSSVAYIELGRRAVSGLELRRFARLYRRSVGWLLGEDDDFVVDPKLAEAIQGLPARDRDRLIHFARFLHQFNGTRP